MRRLWQKFKILQEINYGADRQERSNESRTSLSPVLTSKRRERHRNRKRQ